MGRHSWWKMHTLEHYLAAIQEGLTSSNPFQFIPERIENAEVLLGRNSARWLFWSIERAEMNMAIQNGKPLGMHQQVQCLEL